MPQGFESPLSSRPRFEGHRSAVVVVVVAAIAAATQANSEASAIAAIVLVAGD